MDKYLGFSTEKEMIIFEEKIQSIIWTEETDSMEET